MPLLPEQIAKIRQKETNTPKALQRDPHNGYIEGWFHVTLNTRDDVPVLGYIAGNADAPENDANTPRCVLTELGKGVEKIWWTVTDFHPLCKCEEVQVMPDHIHALLHLLSGNSEHLGRIINGLMIGCTHCYWDMLGIPWRKMRAAKDAAAYSREQDKILRSQWQDRDHTRSFRGPSLFVRGYNDVEAIGENEVNIKRLYIRNNPRKRLITQSAPQCFLIHRNMKSANWTPERIMHGLCADRFIAADRTKQIESWQRLTIKNFPDNRGRISATLKFMPQVPLSQGISDSIAITEPPRATEPPPSRPVFDIVGNMELLKRPLFPLICHRNDAHLFEQQKMAVLRAAREQGGVIVTACVSPKERDIVKLLQQELLPIIEVMANGFSDRYKPTGKAFYAVAEARRLEITPWQYEFHRRAMRPVTDSQGRPMLDASGKPEMEEIPDITREMCMVMNELVRIITKKEDGWWKNLRE